MTRLDVFLKNTGLIRQRSEAKRACDAGRVQVDGRAAKASHAVLVGCHIDLQLEDRVLALEVLDVPARPLSRRDRSGCYRLLHEESRDPYADLEF